MDWLNSHLYENIQIWLYFDREFIAGREKGANMDFILGTISNQEK